MKPVFRNLLVAAAVSLVVGFGLSSLSVLVNAPDLGDAGVALAGTSGILTWFILHLRGANRRATLANPDDRARALSFTCPPQQALVYFVRTGFAGKAVGVDIAIDGKTVAQLTSPRFTCVAVAPGMHELTAQIGDGASTLNPASACSATTLADGSVTLLHVAIQRELLKSRLVFEPWSLEQARAKLAGIRMVCAELRPSTMR